MTPVEALDLVQQEFERVVAKLSPDDRRQVLDDLAEWVEAAIQGDDEAKTYA